MQIIKTILRRSACDVDIRANSKDDAFLPINL
jgi:hypothetical protein